MTYTTLVEAIVCDPRPSNPDFGGDYFKLVYRSDHNEATDHQQELVRRGYRILSLKVRPLYDFDEKEFHVDMQGNMSVVDNKSVNVGE